MPDAGRNEALKGREIDQCIAAVAETQHGLITRAQLGALGATPKIIRVRLNRGTLHLVYPAVYAVGHRPNTEEGRWLAAVLACGPGALLSHRSGAALWRVRNTASARIDVTTHTRRGFSLDAITVHRATTLRPEDRDTVRGIPVTSLSRTIIDLATCVSQSSLEYAIHRAEAQRKLTPADLRYALERHTRVKGTTAVRKIIGAAGHDLDAKTRSRWEVRFLEICRAHDIPDPKVNRWVPLDIPAGGLEVDFCWPAERVVVEVDEHASHRTIRARRRDPERDAALNAADWQVIRVGEERFTDPAVVARAVLDALGYPRPSPWRRRS